MRRPVPKKRPLRQAPALDVSSAVPASSSYRQVDEAAAGTGQSFKLDQLDPRALVIVMTDVVQRESAFTTGDALRQNWESSKVQRVSHFFNQAPVGWCHVTCPDGSTLFLKFNSRKYQLLDEPDTLAPAEVENENTMSDENKAKKPVPPPKKGAAKKPAAKPVKAPVAKKAAAAKPVRLPKTTGNYKWLLRRFQAQAVGQLTTPNNRASVRDGLAKCETFTDTRAFLERAKVTETAAAFDRFCNVFFSATIDR